MPDLLISYLRIQAYSEIQKALLTKDEVQTIVMEWPGQTARKAQDGETGTRLAS